MISNTCASHGQEKQWIYTGNTKQSRKICFKCLSMNGLNIQQCLIQQEFMEKIVQKSESLNMASQLKQSQSKESSKKLLQHLEKILHELTLIIQSIKDLLEAIQVDEKNIEDKFLQLSNLNPNPFEYSDSYLEFLVNFLEGNIFEKEVQKRKNTQSALDQQESFLDNIVKDLYKFYHLIKSLSKNNIESKNEEIIQNREQAKYLQIKGQRGVKGNKINKQQYFWKNQEIGYSNYNIWGQKDGDQNELCDNFSDSKNVIEKGQCQKGKRQGKWSFYKGNKQIGFGEYDQEGFKIGNWNELSEGFQHSSVIYKGVYQRGIKVDRWDIYCEEKGKEEIAIGGGSYSQQGIKTGNWKELDEDFKQEKKIIYEGEYNEKGMKMGQWDTYYCYLGQKKWNKIGGGSYDKESQIKYGKWIELWENFQQYTQVISDGEYSKKGTKVDRWDFLYCQYNKSQYNQIGCGSYSKEGIKISAWQQLDDHFQWEKQIIYKGEYNKQGMKIGQWDIYYCSPGQEIWNKIGGGSYNQQGIKNGKWVELWENFSFQTQITYNGDYNMKGKKVDNWDINDCGTSKEKHKQIGGGSYNQEGIKIGNWIELDEDFKQEKKIIYEGEYNMEGRKFGLWDIKYCGYYESEYERIGGGSYNQEGIKTGEWKELNDNFDEWEQIIQIVEYNDKGYKIHLKELINLEEKRNLMPKNQDY